MKDEALSDALLRQFLLGKLNDEERQRIESLSASDSAMRERVMSAEQDLIEDYLEDSLSADDKERFLLRYGQTPAQQRKLRITKTIKEWALTEAAGVTSDVSPTDVDQPSRSSLWGRLLETLRLRPLLVAPIAVVIVLAIVLGIVWFNRRAEHSAIEQEVARLNDPAHLLSVPPQPGALVLSPGTLRSDEPKREVKLSTDMPVVELRLRWIQADHYPVYRAVVRRIGDNQTITLPNLSADDNGIIRLLLPARHLSRGTYHINLTGPDPAGPSEEYQFAVVE